MVVEFGLLNERRCLNALLTGRERGAVFCYRESSKSFRVSSRRGRPGLILLPPTAKLPSMKSRRPVHAALLVLLVLCAQVTGLRRGFSCEFGGVSHLTPFDHCHGTHHGDCCEHGDHMPAHPHDEHGESGPRHQHEAVVEALLAERVPVTAFSPPPAPILALLSLSDFFAHGLQFAQQAKFEPPRERNRAGPLWPPRLSRSIALLI
jgi:hypothetical protein